MSDGDLPGFDDVDPVARAEAALVRYASLGVKRSGGPGDNGTGEWIEAALSGLGLIVERQTMTVPWTADREARLVVGERSAAVMSHPGAPGGIVHGPLRRWPHDASMPDFAEAIALIDLESNRWSSARDPRIVERVDAAFAGGAVAAVLVTHGPTGAAIALNTGEHGQDYDRPVAIVAPDTAGWLWDVEGRAATLDLTRDEGVRSAFNLIGRLDRGKGRTVVLSTPRSGWTGCAGERGSGIAAWLLLVEWATKSLTEFDVTAFCATGHELGYVGAAEWLRNGAPAPDGVALWVHLGANASTRDFRDVRGQLLALPSADGQRFLAVSATCLDAATRSFTGSTALEAPYDVAQGAAGELANIAAAGYAPVVGVFGAHRFHHTILDDLDCVSAALSADLARRMARTVTAVLR